MTVAEYVRKLQKLERLQKLLQNIRALKGANRSSQSMSPEQGLDRAAELMTGQPGAVAADFAPAQEPHPPMAGMEAYQPPRNRRHRRCPSPVVPKRCRAISRC